MGDEVIGPARSQTTDVRASDVCSEPFQRLRTQSSNTPAPVCEIVLEEACTSWNSCRRKGPFLRRSC